MPNSKSYLGDGVYVSTDGFSIAITTENGICATNEIYIEPDVLRNLIEYCKRKGILNRDPSIIYPDELERCLHSDPNDTGWEK